MNDDVISLLLDTPCNGEQARVFAAAKSEIERLRALLREAGLLFRFYEQSHRAKGPGHEEKVARNADIAGRIEAALKPDF